MRCVLVGNYGVGNLGDEALKDYFLAAFPEIEWIVLSANPTAADEYPRLPGGLRSFFGFQWIKTLHQVRHADALVFGGGSLFTDVESVYACFLWWLHAFIARACGKPLLLAFQGMGPYNTSVGQGIARWVARRSVFISVRDEESAKRLSEWQLNTKIVQTFDPVFWLMKSKIVTTNTKNVFTIIPRHNSGEKLVETVENLINKTSDSQHVHILLMQPNEASEMSIARQMKEKFSHDAEILPAETIDQLMTAMSHSLMVVTQRFHGALAALAAGVPVTILPQGAGDKLSALLPYADGTNNIDEIVAAIKEGEDALRKCLLGLRSV